MAGALMERSVTHHDGQEMLGLYALGALPLDAAATLRAHLETCATCVDELADLEESAAELARAARPVPPSAEVSRRILEAVRSRPPRSAVRLASGHAIEMPRRRLFPIAAGLAVAAVVAMLIVSQIHLLRRLERASSMLVRGREFVDFIASPDVVTIPLVAAKWVPDARALVAYDQRTGRVVVLAFDLAPPPAGKVYQLWVIAESVYPAAVFSTGGLGSTVVHHQWLPGHHATPLFAVTLEPTPGMPDPTGQLLLLGGLPR